MLIIVHYIRIHQKHVGTYCYNNRLYIKYLSLLLLHFEVSFVFFNQKYILQNLASRKIFVKTLKTFFVPNLIIIYFFFYYNLYELSINIKST